MSDAPGQAIASLEDLELCRAVEASCVTKKHVVQHVDFLLGCDSSSDHIEDDVRAPGVD